MFCIPSSIENSKGITPNDLIKKGGRLVTEVKDILEYFQNINFIYKEKKKVDIYIDIPENLIDVYKVITNTPKDANEIAKLLEKSVSEVNYKLTLLQIEDKIIDVSGKGYIRKNDD